MANSDEPVLKQGYLVKSPDVSKHLHVFKKWQRKWFRLHANGDLYYYDSDKASKATGVMHIWQCYRVFEARNKGIQLSYCVGLEIGNNTYYLKAESASSYNEWIKPIAAFAEVSEVSKATSSPFSSRRSTYAGGGDEGEQEELRREGSITSIQSRQLSVSTKAKFNKKEGWLAKTGSNNKGWKDRYVVLTNGKLTYFKNEKADVPQGAIDLFDCINITPTSGKKGYGFDIQVTGRLFNLSTESEEEQKDWISAIKHSLKVIQDIKEPATISRSGSSGSNISDASQGSRELLQEGSSGHLYVVTPERHHTVGSSDMESSFPGSTHGAKKEDRDSVIQLLEAEVDALRSQVSSLESNLKASVTANSQLQDQLAESRRAQTLQGQRSLEDKDILKAQVEQLSKAKEELETINDSLHTQLDEQLGRVQLLEEEQLGMKQELEEVHTSATTAEEELAETQQRLQEIQDVARELETALRKKEESEPATPLKQTLSSVAKLEFQFGEPLNSSNEHPTESSVNSSRELQELRRSLQSVEDERDSFRRELETLRQAKNVVDSEAAEARGASNDLGEERLKWQMEMENLRREYEARVVEEKEAHSRESAALARELAEVEKKCASLEQSSEKQKSELQENLNGAQSRIQQLEGEMSIHQQRVAQLQVEKEKALTDLIAIRKINRSMEKRMNGSEVESHTGSPGGSPTTSIESPGVQHQLAEAERKLEEMRTALLEVMKERDQLKERLHAGATPNGVSGPEVDLNDTSHFLFKSKAGPTIAASSESPSAPSRSPRTQTFRHSIKRVTQLPSLEPAGTGSPPPKPKRPPKELVVRYQALQQQQEDERPRTRTASVLQTLFARR